MIISAVDWQGATHLSDYYFAGDVDIEEVVVSETCVVAVVEDIA